jgi:sec-independent protein translocase protein TatA
MTAAIALYLTNRSTGAATLDELRFREEFMFEGLFQPMHLLVIFGIALLVFGPKKLPELGKGIGEGIRGFKSAMREQEEAPDQIAITDRDSGPR